MDEPPLLLFPQTVAFPLRVEQKLETLNSFLVFELPFTREVWVKNWPKLVERAKFLRLKDEFSPNFETLKKTFYQLKDWAIYLRDLQNLKVLKRHLQPEEPFSLIPKEREYSLNKIERALLVLMLAEDLDLTLYEVNKSLHNFESSWDDFFKESITGEDPVFEDLKLPAMDATPPDVLPNLNSRITAWETLFPYLDLNELSGLKILISEDQCLDLIQKSSLNNYHNIRGSVTIF